ncbi:hypothetical protein ACH4SK_17360 [Streptomyces inhibens]|uniref:hypothetical protein n=1 Tax=Streptomyces inhibens TaxID=2293571 RepID=UPI0037A976D4
MLAAGVFFHARSRVVQLSLEDEVEVEDEDEDEDAMVTGKNRSRTVYLVAADQHGTLTHWAGGLPWG